MCRVRRNVHVVVLRVKKGVGRVDVPLSSVGVTLDVVSSRHREQGEKERKLLSPNNEKKVFLLASNLLLLFYNKFRLYSLANLDYFVWSPFFFSQINR